MSSSEVNPKIPPGVRLAIANARLALRQPRKPKDEKPKDRV